MMDEDMLEACSDAETEAPFMTLSNYQIKDKNHKYVSLAALPIQWDEEHDEDSDASKEQVILHGFTAKGLEEILMPVMAWRFDLSHAKPEIYLQSSTDKRWIKLQKPPRHGYKDTIRNVLVAVHFLHFIKKNPEETSDTVLASLFKDRDLSSYRLLRFLKDLVAHMTLIHEAAERLAGLSNAETVLEDLKTLLEEWIRDDGVAMEVLKEQAYFGRVLLCAICDEVDPDFHCEGPCWRKFHTYHPIKFTTNKPMPIFLSRNSEYKYKQPRCYCMNCEYDQHQCFACGELGSSDIFKGAEVFQCAYEYCTHFYHRHCFAKLIGKEQKDEANVDDVNSFICPAHHCCVCNGVENSMEHDLHFAMCGRCPRSYHRMCLPSEIVFEGHDDGVLPRAWERKLPFNRIYMYCMDHVMNEETAKPVLDIRFPEVEER